MRCAIALVAGWRPYSSSSRLANPSGDGELRLSNLGRTDVGSGSVRPAGHRQPIVSSGLHFGAEWRPESWWLRFADSGRLELEFQNVCRSLVAITAFELFR